MQVVLYWYLYIFGYNILFSSQFLLRHEIPKTILLQSSLSQQAHPHRWHPSTRTLHPVTDDEESGREQLLANSIAIINRIAPASQCRTIKIYCRQAAVGHDRVTYLHVLISVCSCGVCVNIYILILSYQFRLFFIAVAFKEVVTDRRRNHNFIFLRISIPIHHFST